MLITKKQIDKFTKIALLFAFCFTLFLPVGRAEEDKTENFPQVMIDEINNGAIRTIRNNLTSNNGNNALYEFIMADNPDSVVSKFANLTKGVCGFVIVIIAVSKYFQELDKGHDPEEGIYKMLTEIFLVGFCMVNIDWLLQKVVELGEWLIGAAEQITGSPDKTGVLTLEMISGKDSGFILWWVQCVFILLIPWILTMLLQIVAQFTAFSLLIELGIRKAFAPGAVCDIYSEGLRSPGVRYLKRFLATFIKIAICLLVCSLGQVLMGAAGFDNIGDGDPAAYALNNVLQYIFRIIAINFTVIGVMNKTGEYANDIVGV